MTVTRTPEQDWKIRQQQWRTRRRKQQYRQLAYPALQQSLGRTPTRPEVEAWVTAHMREVDERYG
jgi:hypothetical protein